MTDVHEPWTNEGDEDATIRLLRAAGARSPVPDVRAARVRAEVHARWQAGARRRLARKRAVLAAASVAALLVIALVVRFTTVERQTGPIGEPVAVVERLDGGLERVSTGSSGSIRTALSPRDTIRTGDSIETDAGGRVALRFSNGTSARLDVGSRARLLSAAAMELSTGAVYVDTGREAGRFEVRTPIGTARDVGTQFEVRLIDRAIRLRVRSGAVELNDGARSISGRGGTEITFSASDAVSRPLATHGVEWDWTARVSPPIEIEGMALAGFLEALAREHGWTLRYADRALASDAAGIILHGSINGLSPREAIAVAIATSGLRYQLEGAELTIQRETRGPVKTVP